MSKIRITGLLLVVAMIIGISSCSFDSGDSDDGNASVVENQLKFENLSKLAFMGGSLMYNPERSVGGQLTKGAKVAVRLSSLDGGNNETAASYGYITVTSVDGDSISVSYTPYDSDGVKAASVSKSIALDGTADINGDGKPDLSYEKPRFQRDGMENAVYLNFLSSPTAGNVSMYSVIPEQYARAAFPNGMMGISPDGRFIISKYETNGARAAVRGVEYGDVVVDNESNKYETVKNGAKYRGAAVRIGEDSGDLETVDTTWSNGPADGIDSIEDGDLIDPTNPPVSATDNPNATGSGVQMAGTVNADPDYFASDQFNPVATPQKLYDALPASLQTGSPSDEAAYIIALNAVLDNAPATVIPALLIVPSVVADSDLKTLLEAAQTGTYSSDTEKVYINRTVLSKVFPEWCPLVTPRGITDMFPIVSLSFSDEDANEVMVAAIAQARAAMAIDNSDSNGRAMASSYSVYTAQKKALKDLFNRSYTNFGTISLDDDSLKELKNYVSDPELSVTIGLYGSLTNYWGKIELGVGAALMLNVEAHKPRAPITKTWKKKFEPKKTMTVGVVVLDIGVETELGLKLQANVQSDNFFAGYIGLYGGTAWVGADYGVRWKWGFIPIGAYFNPYSRAVTLNQTIYYFGREDPSKAVTASGNFILSPFISIGPKLTLWKSIYGKVETEAQLPVTVSFPSLTASAGLNLEISASTGINFDVKIFSYTRQFAEWKVFEKYIPFY
jgi:hypothetical protein